MSELTRDGSVVRPDGAEGGGVSFGPIIQCTTPTSVAHVLRDAILDGTLKPGSQLREIHLDTDLGVSRAPLREALAVLADEGLVEKIPYRGAFVAVASVDDVAEIASLRNCIEPYAIKLALPSLNGGARTKVTQALDNMRIGADANDPAATINAHTSFLRAFYELSGHKLLLGLRKSWETQLQLFFSADHQSFADLHEIVAEHARLLQIIDTGDLAAITVETERHVHGSVPQAETSAATAENA